MKQLIVLIITLIIISGGGLIYFREGSLPVNNLDITTHTFTVQPGEALSSIAKDLENQGFIRNKIVFYAIVKQLGIERSIQAGDFSLSSSMDAYSIANTLTHGTTDKWVTIIEGLRKEEIAQTLSQKLNIPEVEIIKASKEGYLFPDTYLFPQNSSAEMVIQIFENNFSKKFKEVSQGLQSVHGLTPHEILILASLIEKEARFDKDRPIIAGILINRLNEGWKLDIDATVQYAIGYQSTEKTWWKKYLTEEDLKIESPYNTRLVAGLPPGPICNPGASSIRAIFQADILTPYMFYISDDKGVMHYAKTLEEHNLNISKYLD